MFTRRRAGVPEREAIVFFAIRGQNLSRRARAIFSRWRTISEASLLPVFHVGGWEGSSVYRTFMASRRALEEDCMLRTALAPVALVRLCSRADSGRGHKAEPDVLCCLCGRE